MGERLNTLTLVGAAASMVERKCCFEFVVELDWGRVLLFACGGGDGSAVLPPVARARRVLLCGAVALVSSIPVKNFRKRRIY